MDWTTVAIVAPVATAVLAGILHLLGILEKIWGWGRRAWTSLRGGQAAETSPSQPFVGFQREPDSDFKLLPQQFSVELSAQLPYIELRFFAVNFLSRPITLNEVRLSVRLLGASPIEAIPLIQHDWRIEPKDSPIVVCRRNLWDTELKNLPWRTGHESGSFELVAKATAGKKMLTYGPVSSRVIEGWINGPIVSK